MKAPALSLVEKVYLGVKSDLFEFRLLPGDRFTETEVAIQREASRTPVREALMRLEREGYLQMKSRAGWMVKPFDFRLFQELYDLRSMLETASVRKLAQGPLPPRVLQLAQVWLVTPDQQIADGAQISQADEEFHQTLVTEAGNAEVSKLHHEVTERIRIIRRLGYASGDRLSATYDDHQAILEDLYASRVGAACARLEAHIAANRDAVEHITLARLEAARSQRQTPSIENE